MRLLNLFTASFLLIILFVACSAPVEGIDILPCKDFDKKVQATENAQLIDVRTPGEFSSGTIGAAVNVDYNADNFKAEMDKLDKDRTVFVFCAKGGRSASAATICKELGFKTIYDLEGGYTAWSQYKK
jgi:rhodanese-related sulfurtransferase